MAPRTSTAKRPPDQDSPRPWTPKDELDATVSAEIGLTTSRAIAQADLLHSIATQAIDLAGEIHRDAAPRELIASAHAIRGLVLHALAVLADLQCAGGRLDALAALRTAALQDRSSR